MRAKRTLDRVFDVDDVGATYNGRVGFVRRNDAY